MRIWLIPLLAAWLPAGVLAGDPLMTEHLPRGARVGSEVELTLKGQRMADPLGLFLYREGIEVLEVIPGDAGSCRIRVCVASDCPPGEHPFRLRTSHGISNLRTFHVGILPEVEETEPNDSVAAARPLALDVTVNGTIRSGDLDVFAIDFPAGQEITFEVQGVRLGSPLWDPRLRLLDAQGRILAEAEDSARTLMDPVLLWRQPEAARIHVEVCDTAYSGSDNTHYRLHVGRFPRPSGAIPAGGRPGESIEVAFVGLGTPFRETLTIPQDAAGVLAHFPRNERGMAPTPVFLAAAPFPTAVEAPDAPGCTPEAPALDPPVAVNGLLAAPGEEDVWRVNLKKGQEMEIASLSRALRSPLDAVIRVEGPKGLGGTEADDSGGSPDPRLTFRPTQDGVYTIAIRDHLRRGGPEFFYRLHIATPRRPVVTRVNTPRREDRTPVSVPRAGRMAFLLQTEGPGGDTPRTIGFEGLPEGAQASADAYIPARTSLTPVVLAATESAPLAGKLVSLTLIREGTGTPEDAGLAQAIPLLRVDNDDPYYTVEVRRLAVAVTERLPFRVELLPPRVPLVRNSPMDLKFRIHRDAEFKQPVSVRMLWNPPGVNAGEVRVPGDKDEGVLPLYCGGSAPEGRWKIAVIGTADGGGSSSSSSELVDLNVQPPFFSLEIGKVWAEQGESVDLPLTLKRRRDVSATFRPEILNLPRGLVLESPEIDQDATSCTLKLAVAPDAPCGRYKDIVIRLRLALPEGEIIHHYRGGEIRIEKPLPKAEGAMPGQKRAWGTVGNPKT